VFPAENIRYRNRLWCKYRTPWRIEGSKKVKQIFASTGKAIFLTSTTSMLAFGSLVFSIWRGFGSLGAAMFIGVGTCFLLTAIILSGIIGWLERKIK